MKRDPFSRIDELFRTSRSLPDPSLSRTPLPRGDRESTPYWIKILLLLFGILAFMVLIYTVRTTLIPLFVSMLIAYLLMPLSDFLENRGLGIIPSISITFFVFFALLFLIVLYLIPVINLELSGFSSGLPRYIGTVNAEIAQVQSRLSQYWPAIQEVDVSLNIQRVVLDKLNSIPAYIANIFSIFPLLILVPLISFFFLKDAKKIKKVFLAMVPNRYFEMVLGLLVEIDRNIGSYIRGQLLRSTIIGGLTFLGLTLFGLKYALLLAIFAGIMNLVPYAGPLIGSIPAVILAFLNQANPAAPLALLSPLPLVIHIILVYIVVQSLDAVWIAPYILGWSVDIHPLGIVLLLLFGNQLFGWWGIILAVPVASIFRLVLQAMYKRYETYRL
jgi:predicted PurR-regulated permease PerM